MPHDLFYLKCASPTVDIVLGLLPRYLMYSERDSICVWSTAVICAAIGFTIGGNRCAHRRWASSLKVHICTRCRCRCCDQLYFSTPFSGAIFLLGGLWNLIRSHHGQSVYEVRRRKKINKGTWVILFPVSPGHFLLTDDEPSELNV
jgi:hypothetical protein